VDRPSTVYQVWKAAEGDYDDPGEAELIATLYSRAKADALVLQRTRKDYLGYVAEGVCQLAEAQAAAAAMSDASIAYCDWLEAVRFAPSKEMRVTAGEMVAYCRTRPGRADLGHDWRQSVVNIREQFSLSHEEWAKKGYGGYPVTAARVDCGRPSC
jgi:hypothetical protein